MVAMLGVLLMMLVVVVNGGLLPIRVWFAVGDWMDWFDIQLNLWWFWNWREANRFEIYFSRRTKSRQYMSPICWCNGIVVMNLQPEWNIRRHRYLLEFDLCLRGVNRSKDGWECQVSLVWADSIMECKQTRTWDGRMIVGWASIQSRPQPTLILALASVMINAGLCLNRSIRQRRVSALDSNRVEVDSHPTMSWYLYWRSKTYRHRGEWIPNGFQSTSNRNQFHLQDWQEENIKQGKGGIWHSPLTDQQNETERDPHNTPRSTGLGQQG